MGPKRSGSTLHTSKLGYVTTSFFANAEAICDTESSVSNSRQSPSGPPILISVGRVKLGRANGDVMDWKCTSRLALGQHWLSYTGA